MGSTMYLLPILEFPTSLVSISASTSSVKKHLNIYTKMLRCNCCKRIFRKYIGTFLIKKFTPLANIKGSNELKSQTCKQICAKFQGSMSYESQYYPLLLLVRF